MPNGNQVLTKLLKELAQEMPIFSTHRREVMKLAIETLEAQQLQIESQENVIRHLKLQLSHLQDQASNLSAQVGQWHKIADERSGEIQRLLGEIEAMRKREHK